MKYEPCTCDPSRAVVDLLRLNTAGLVSGHAVRHLLPFKISGLCEFQEGCPVCEDPDFTVQVADGNKAL